MAFQIIGNHCLYCETTEKLVVLEYREDDNGVSWYQCFDQPACIAREQYNAQCTGVQTFEYQRFLAAMNG